MASGYLIAKNELEQLQKRHEQEGGAGSWGGYETGAPSLAWPFAQLIPLLGEKPEDSAQGKDLEQQLKAASSIFLKAWKLIPELRRVGAITAAGVCFLLFFLCQLLLGGAVFFVSLRP